MPKPARRKNLAGLADYPVLLARVRETFVLGQQKIEELKLTTYWEAGRLIHEHLEFHESEAGYGKQCMAKLARSIDVGDELLYRMVRFYEAYPISSSWRKLSWSHFRTLARIPDKQKREELEVLAEREQWDAATLEKQVSFVANVSLPAKNESFGRAVQLLEPKRGTPGIYRIVADGDHCAIDLGFTSYQSINRGSGRESAHSSALKPDSLVTLSSTGEPVSASDATKAGLYTYAAEILRVVDGDTLVLKIWLKPGHWLKEKLRLRGLDAPELGTPEGKAAKRFIEGLVKQAVSVTVTTTKPDKWDRYLSDIFLTMPSPRGGEGEQEIFLNNELLKCGHARRYDNVKPVDWEE